MLVLAEIVVDDGAIPAARGDERNFTLECAEAFKDAGRAELLVCAGNVGFALQADLAASVIAEASRLQDCRQTDARDSVLEIGLRADCREWRRCDTEGLEEAFFVEAVLGDGERVGAGRDASASGDQGFGGLCRHVFELGGDDRDTAREIGEGGGVEIIADDGFRSDP